MKLWFEGCDVNASGPEKPLRGTGGGQTVRPKNWKRERGASHGLHDVGTADRMAQPRAGLHEQARSPCGADLQAAGRGRRALEGDPDPRRAEEEGKGRRPL